MPRPRHSVTDAELAVLESLWGAEPATIRELTERLYPGGGTSHYATVQKLLERLEAKGYVRRQRTRVPHSFRSRIDREHLISNGLRDIADKLCEGSLTPLLTQLVEQERLAPDEVDALRELVNRLEREGGEA